MSENKITGKLELDDGNFDFDRFLRKIKCDFGKYQIFLVMLLIIPACFQSTYSMFDLVFLTYTPKHQCNNFNDSYHKDIQQFINSSFFEINPCTYTIHYQNDSSIAKSTHKCHDWIYDKTYFDETVVTKWNFVCDQAITIRTILSLFQIAYLMAIIYSYIQDRWGRKKAFIVNLTVYLLGSSTCLLARSPITFATLKFIGSVTGMWKISYCWALEFVGSSKRTTVATILSVSYGIAGMSLAGVAYFCRTWIEVGLCTTLPFVLLYSYAFLVPESPRWLLANGKIDQFLEIVETMGRWQKVDVNTEVIKTQIIRKETIPETTEKENITLKTFFSNSNLRWKTALLTLILIIGNQLYFVVPFSMENFQTNFYAAYLIQAAIETPATLLNLILLDRFGRIKPLSMFLFLSALCCILSWPAGRFGRWGPVIMAALARFFVCIPVYIVEQLGAELFPTVYRGIRQGVTSFFLSLVMMTTQYVIYSSQIWNVLPLLIMGILTLIASLLTLFLPETKGLSLPDSVHQAELQGSVGIKSFKENIKLNCF